MCGITEMRLSANDPCINHNRKVIGALLRFFSKNDVIFFSVATHSNSAQ